MKTKLGSSIAAPTAADRSDNFANAFFALKHIFLAHEKHLHITADTRGRYYLETRSHSYKGRPLFFGAVISGRTNVGFHLMPLYWDATLRNRVSPKLKKHMEGKSCFNFTEAPDPALQRELIKLTSAGFTLYKRKNLL